MRRQIDSNELGCLFHRIGSAIWHLQNVENSLVPLIIIKGIAKDFCSLTESDALVHESKLKKCTLGQLIRQVKEQKLINDELLSRLQYFNNERKWLVHNSVFESGDDLYTDQGRKVFFERVEKFVYEATCLHRDIANDLVDYTTQRGSSRNEIELNANKAIRKLKGEI